MGTASRRSAERHGHQLETVVAGDRPEAWRDAGFTVNDDRVTVGSTSFVLDPGAGSGIVAVSITGVDGPVDGLPIAATAPPSDAASPPDHRNRVTGLDHLVALSPAIDRTADALHGAGLERRRSRPVPGSVGRRQDFFWLGDVILELVGDEVGTGDAHPELGPARFWGLAFTCADLDAAHAELAGALGTPKDAVQVGRRIATLRTRDLGISVPIAFLSPHPGRG